MKKLIVLVFSIVLFGSCSSEKVLSERLKHDWNINYLENYDVDNSFTTIEDYQYVNENSNNILNDESESESLTASTQKVFTNNKKHFVSLSKKVEELKKVDGDCDNIIFKNGDELSAKVIEIATDVVKYKRCDNLDGPLISVQKSELLMIRYKNGSKEIFKDNSAELEKTKNYDTNKNHKTDGFALTGMITGIMSIITLFTIPGLIFSLVFGVCGIVFSTIGFKRIKENSSKIGRGFAITGLITSILFLLFVTYSVIYFSNNYISYFN